MRSIKPKSSGISTRTVSSFSVNKMLISILLFSVLLNSEIINGQKQQLFMYLMPVPSPQNSLAFLPKTESRYLNRGPINYNSFSSGEMKNEIQSSEEAITNIRPIYFLKLHDQTHNKLNYQRSEDNTFFSRKPSLPPPPHITPLVIRQYGSGARGGGNIGASRHPSNFWLPPQPFDKSFNTMVGKEEHEEDDNGSSINSNSAEYDLQNLGNERHHQYFHFVKDNDDTRTITVVPSSPKPMQLHMPPHRRLSSSHVVQQDDTIISHQNHESDYHQRCIMEGHQAAHARYDPITGICYTVGTKGPCGKFMIFTASPNDNINGYCSCDYDSFDRPFVLVGGKCQFLYTQGVCFPGHWLTAVAPNGKPICQENPCQSLSSYNNGNSVVFFKGECIKLNSPSRHCRREGEVVLFPKGSNLPACGFPKSTKRLYRRQISNIKRLACGPGMKRHRVTRRCVRTRAIVFH